MAFTAADVKNLREMTGVGMLDCKKALAETDGDMDKAVELLREKGLAAAQKKAGRIAAEGMAYAEVFSDGAALVEVNAETDFVAKNAQFIEFVKDVCYVVGKWGPVDMDTLMTLPYRKTGMTVQQALQDKIMVIGENIKIRRFVRYDSGVSVAYNHMNGRIGVLLNMEVSAGLEENEKVQELGKDLAMQIAAMNPAYLDKSDVSQDTLDKEKEIQLAMMANDPKMAAKPEKVKEGIVMGKLGKYYEENCLMQQAFVKENKVSVEKHVAAVAKEVGGEINHVEKFGRWKDAAVMLEGEAVRSLTAIFLQMWDIAREPEFEAYLKQPIPAPAGAKGFAAPYGDCPLDGERVGELVYIDLLNRARKYIHIMTPYLILDGELETALKFAAERGVDVHLILPGKPDKRIPYALAKTHYAALIRSGVKISEWVPGFVHAKVFVMDDREAVVGTINLDYRSLYHHFEDAVWMVDAPCIPAIEDDFQRTLTQCRTVEATTQSIWQGQTLLRLTGRLVKAIAPLL